MSYRVAWMFLVLSIILDVSGTSIMKGSQENWPVLGMMIMYVLLGFSYFTLSKAVIKLPIGVAYAFWEGVGLCLITLVSVLILGEQLGLIKLTAIAMLLGGTYLVHHGTDSGEDAKEDDNIEAFGDARLAASCGATVRRAFASPTDGDSKAAAKEECNGLY